MENLQIKTNNTVKMKCPDCLNYMILRTSSKGKLSGTCSVCKSKVFRKEHSENETHIRIIRVKT